MKVISAAIQQVIEITAASGNTVKVVSGDWKPKQVVFMSEPLSESAKEEIIRQMPHLRYFKSEETPHNPPDEGFVADDDDVAISFPIAGETMRWY